MAELPQYRPGECGETTGFLFSHACGEISLHICTQCQKPICMHHTVVCEEGTLCTTCAKSAPSRTGASRTNDDDPYFYSDTYYPGYRRVGHDFNDSDERLLRESEPTADEIRAFEGDMGAS